MWVVDPSCVLPSAAAPVVYTSYDYAAPLRETRQQQDKLFQTKLVNMFAASTPALLKTYMHGNGTGYLVGAHLAQPSLSFLSD